MPAQKWADLTGSNGDFGVSVFSDSKYGWDKPDDHTLRLTCLHTPAGAFIKEARQDLMDLGRNRFGFGIYSHKGGRPARKQRQKPLANRWWHSKPPPARTASWVAHFPRLH